MDGRHSTTPRRVHQVLMCAIVKTASSRPQLYPVRHKWAARTLPNFWERKASAASATAVPRRSRRVPQVLQRTSCRGFGTRRRSRETANLANARGASNASSKESGGTATRTIFTHLSKNATRVASQCVRQGIPVAGSTASSTRRSDPKRGRRATQRRA